MSGSFENIDVPPTLVSFAVTTDNINNIISPEFKSCNSKVVLIKPDYNNDGLPVASSLKNVFNLVNTLMRDKKVLSAYTPTYGGIAEAVFKMCIGNRIGFKFNSNIDINEIFKYNYGSFILELNCSENIGIELGSTINLDKIIYNDIKINLEDLSNQYENKLESIYSCNIKTLETPIPKINFNNNSVSIKNIAKFAKPRVLIPVFPGTNCEYDSAKAVEKAGAIPEIFVINNLSAKNISESTILFANKLKESQMVFIPGGFSGGDEPDGSGKFITAFFRNNYIKDAVNDLLENRDGLMCGICNGFQSLIKLRISSFRKNY